MKSVGKSLRLARLFDRNGKGVIIPIDHGLEGHYPELENPSGIIKEVVNAGADGLLLRRGLIESASDLFKGRVGIVYRITGATGTNMTDQHILSSVNEAIRYGADCIVFTVTSGHANENDMLEDYGAVAELCNDYQIPLMGEVDVFDDKKADAWESVRRTVRALSEEGSDVVKTYLPGDASHYKDIIRYSLVPVVAAGGAKMHSALDVVKFARRVMDSGAVGTCIGRNVWQQASPGKIVKALSAVVKENKDIEAAGALLS